MGEGARGRLSGLRGGHLPPLAVACVNAELLLDFQVRETTHCLRCHRSLRCFIEETAVVLHGLIEALLYLHLLNVRVHITQVGQRRVRGLVMRAAADEESRRDHDRNGEASHRRIE